VSDTRREAEVSDTAREAEASDTAPDIAVAARRAAPAERRGRTDISERVVSRVASRAAGEVPRVRAVHDRVGHSPDVRLEGRVATIGLDLALEYPASIKEVAAEVRRHVVRRVNELTGLAVAQVNIGVSELERS
jgi:uncharacterized alkaline shock family protein YloU